LRTGSVTGTLAICLRRTARRANERDDAPSRVILRNVVLQRFAMVRPRLAVTLAPFANDDAIAVIVEATMNVYVLATELAEVGPQRCKRVLVFLCAHACVSSPANGLAAHSAGS